MLSPPQVHHKSLSLGEVLDGDRMAESLYQIRFRENVEKKPLCHLTLTETQVFVDATQTGGLAWELMIRKQPEHMRFPDTIMSSIQLGTGSQKQTEVLFTPH